MWHIGARRSALVAGAHGGQRGVQSRKPPTWRPHPTPKMTSVNRRGGRLRRPAGWSATAPRHGPPPPPPARPRPRYAAAVQAAAPRPGRYPPASKGWMRSSASADHPCQSSGNIHRGSRHAEQRTRRRDHRPARSESAARAAQVRTERTGLAPITLVRRMKSALMARVAGAPHHRAKEDSLESRCCHRAAHRRRGARAPGQRRARSAASPS